MRFLENKYILLLILALIWGSSFFLIKKSVAVYSPYHVGALRVGLAGLALAFWGIPTLKKLDKVTLFWVALAGCLGNFIPMFLFPIAETRVTSSLAGVLNSLVPIFTLLLGSLLFGFKSNKKQILGAILGFLGAVFLMYFGQNSKEDSSFGYSLLIVLACVSYALNGLIIQRRLRHLKSLELGSAVFTFWGFFSFLLLLFSGFFSKFTGTTEQWAGLGYVGLLSFFGTTIAMLLFYRLLQKTEAVFASSVTYLMPLVAILWGVWDGEPFTSSFVFGAMFILGGIYLIRKK